MHKQRKNWNKDEDESRDGKECYLNADLMPYPTLQKYLEKVLVAWIIINKYLILISPKCRTLNIIVMFWIQFTYMWIIL